MDALRGRFFIIFVALCYYQDYAKAVNGIKSSLGKINGKSEHDKSENIKLELRLKSWLENKSYLEQLQWFEVVENMEVADGIRKRRWTSEITKRDSLFLKKLGVTPTK